MLILRTSQSRVAIISESCSARFLYEAFLEFWLLSCKPEEVSKSRYDSVVCFINGVFYYLKIDF